MRLLVGNANQLGHLLLRPAEQDSALAHPSANVVVDFLRPRFACDALSGHHALLRRQLPDARRDCL
jgi:hypothetical protein